MALQKITFSDALVTAADHGALFAGILTDGMLGGAEITYAGGNVGIPVAYLIACGRLIQNDASLSVAVSGASGVAQVVLIVSVSGSGSLSTAVRTAVSVDALPALTQEDINDGVSTTYEVELAVVDLAAGTLLRSLGAAGPAGLDSNQLRHIFVSTQDPTADDGQDGDIWIKVGS